MTKIDYSATVDRSRVANALLVETIESFGLKYSIGDDEPSFFEMTLEAQKGLSFELWLCLQNNDELWMGIEDDISNPSFCMFPYDHVKEEFTNALTGLILGEYRIFMVKSFSNEWVSWMFNSAKLEKPNGDEWISLASQGSYFGWLLFPWRNRVLVNVDAQNLPHDHLSR